MFTFCHMRKREGLKLTSTSGFLQVGLHAVVVREYGRGGSDLCTHVADGRHPCSHHRHNQTTEGFYITNEQNVKALQL